MNDDSNSILLDMCVLPMEKNEKDTSIQYKLRLVYTWIDIKLYNKQETWNTGKITRKKIQLKKNS